MSKSLLTNRLPETPRFVKLPEAGAIPPIGEFSIVPPVIVNASATLASVTASLAISAEPTELTPS